MSYCKIDGCENKSDRQSHGRAGLCYHHWVRRSPDVYQNFLEKKRIRGKRWNDKNKDKRHQIWRKYYDKNKRKINIKSVRWRNDNPDKSRETRRRYYWNNKTEVNKRQKTYRLQEKLTVFNHYTNNDIRCMCDCRCEEKNMTMLTIDHINSDGYTDREDYRSIMNRGFPPTYTVLCWNCNIGRARNRGICPRL